MKVNIHIGTDWQSQDTVRPRTMCFPENQNGYPLPTQKIIENLQLAQSCWVSGEIHILTLSTIILDTIRVMKKKTPNLYQVIVYFDGTSCEVDADGRMERFPSEFDVYDELLKELM